MWFCVSLTWRQGRPSWLGGGGCCSSGGSSVVHEALLGADKKGVRSPEERSSLGS